MSHKGKTGVDGDQTNTHAVPPVIGYTPLTDDQVDTMNLFKAKEAEVLALAQSILDDSTMPVNVTYMQIGMLEVKGSFMWLNRAIAKHDEV